MLLKSGGNILLPLILTGNISPGWWRGVNAIAISLIIVLAILTLLLRRRLLIQSEQLARHSSELNRMNREKESIQQLSRKLTGCRNVREVGKSMAAQARKIFGYDAFSLYHIDLKENKIIEIYNEDTGEIENNPHEVPVNPPRNIRADPKLLSLPRLINRKNVPQESDKIPFGETFRLSRSLMFAPISQNEELVGRITVQSYTLDKYNEDNLRLLEIFADNCGAALARTRAEDALHERDKKYRLIVETAEEGVWMLDNYNRTSFVNQKLAEMLGYTVEEMKNMPMKSFMDRDLHPAATSYIQDHRMGIQEQHDMKFRRKDGSELWSLVTTNPIYDSSGNHHGTLAMVTDITDRKKAEQQLMHDAFHDSLTGLPNRALFLDRLGVCMGRIKRRDDYLFAVLFLDLDRFKNVNDSLGHEAGDQLLIEIARRIKTCLRPGDTVARHGGDEFSILLDDMVSEEDAKKIADRIQKDLSMPAVIRGHEVFTSASIGIAISSSKYAKSEELLRDADTAMYRAKALGKSRYEFFETTMHEHAVSLFRMESEMRRSLETERFFLRYQPIASLSTGKVSGFEALLRWDHPTKGIIKPEKFLRLAEETGLIIPLCWKTVLKATKNIIKWRRLYPSDPPLTVNINFSGKQFSQPFLIKKMSRILNKVNSGGRVINLEITESILMEQADHIIQLLHKLKSMDIELHVDDFGTGYSSLSYLHRFPIDAFKIDSSFVSNMDREPVNVEIIRTILDLADNLNLKVTAEGVETENQLKALRKMKCQYVQGFFISPPLLEEEVEELLALSPSWVD